MRWTKGGSGRVKLKQALVGLGMAGVTWTGAGCGNSGPVDDGMTLQPTSTTSLTSTSTTATTTQATPIGFSRVTINSVFMRAVPTTATRVRLTGSTAQGTVLYGPVTQNVAASNMFDGVPVNVAALRLEYLSASDEVQGIFTTGVSLVAGGDFVLNNPDYTPSGVPVATRFNLVKPLVNQAIGEPQSENRVQVLDQFGRPLSGATVSVRLGSSSTADATLLGATSATTGVDGIATFDSLGVDSAGTYTLVFSTPGLGELTSSSFTVAASGSTDLMRKFFALFSSQGFSVINSFPNQSARWDLDSTLGVGNGLVDAFDEAGQLVVGGSLYTAASPLTYVSPLQTSASGLLIPSISARGALEGNQSAALPPVNSCRLTQQVALPAGATNLNLSWRDAIGGQSGSSFPDETFVYQVIIRNAQDEVLAVAYARNSSQGDTAHTFNLAPYAGQTVRISFEAQRYYSNFEGSSLLLVDAVSLKDSAGAELISNGNFEASTLTGWTATSSPASTTIRGAVQNLGGLDVTRTVFSPPGESWIRYYDEFTNSGTSPVTTTLVYQSNSGADGQGASFFVEGSQNRALSNSDAGGLFSDPDTGFVFGTGATLDPTQSYPIDEFDVSFENVSLQPGETKALCFFLLANGHRSAGQRPAEIEADALKILANAKTRAPYAAGLSATQLGRILNF